MFTGGSEEIQKWYATISDQDYIFALSLEISPPYIVVCQGTSVSSKKLKRLLLKHYSNLFLLMLFKHNHAHVSIGMVTAE